MPQREARQDLENRFRYLLLESARSAPALCAECQSGLSLLFALWPESFRITLG